MAKWGKAPSTENRRKRINTVYRAASQRIT
jgi:hypothetical protein